MNIGQAIVTIRKARKMTQKELAERCGMSQNALVDIEKNRSQPPMKTMKRLQEALGVPQSYILLYSIEDCDIPEDKLKTAKHLLMPLKEYLLKEDLGGTDPDGGVIGEPGVNASDVMDVNNIKV